MTKPFTERLRVLTPAIGVLVLVGIWSIAHTLKIADPVLLPSPGETFRELWQGLAGGTLAHDAWTTVLRTLYSFAIALSIGVPLGIVLGASDRIYRSIEFVIDFFRSTPASVVFPLFLVLFGTGEKTKIAVAAFGAALVILFNVAYGVMNARKQRLLAARVMGASPLQVMVDVTVWESLPQTFVGIRSGISLALVIVIVAEMFIGSTDGLGHRVVNAQMVFEMPTMYAAIFTAGLLGYVLNLLFIVMERRFVHWSGR
ncbi:MULTISPECIES: ABC transporter permease [Ramlibacter]|uniref:ABC transporter permease subunit n=1 Tax=Ramlibacter pinisoli TaxID=2682844 RepID=A0A6N8IM68_9BURK|nr:MULTISPECIES: ABC transporter permease [Ramlibacter]MBA2960557.1 ABC transporter permease [Ramlibacter sp. CGMCC 1.13660]MVQ27888.1 ABC transporter permease subunit [Ramlibacter pinisoli]